MDCHNGSSRESIEKVVSWFKESSENNLIYTFYNEKQNKDVYMVALRDDSSTLIGYYERLGFKQLGTIPGGFRMKDGHFENICPYYIELV